MRREASAGFNLEEDLLAPVTAPEVELEMPAEPEDEDVGHEPPQMGDDTTIIREGEGFALAPLDVTGITTGRGRRRRKLVVDELKNITGEQMKAQLNDPSDLVGTLDLAPPSLVVMNLRDDDKMEKHSVAPSCYFEATALCEVCEKILRFSVLIY